MFLLHIWVVMDGEVVSRDRGAGLDQTIIECKNW